MKFDHNWWHTYSPKNGETVVLTHDMGEFKSGTLGSIVDPEIHESINGILARIMLSGATKSHVMCEGDFIPVKCL